MPSEAPIRLIDKGHQIAISQISLFEVSAKGAKYVDDGILEPETVTEGIRAIANDDNIELVSTYDSEILISAFEFRKVLSDFIDCLIISTAIHNCDALVTEDNEIHEIAKNSNIYQIFKRTKSNFKFLKICDLI